MTQYFEKLKQQIADNPPNLGDADSVLGCRYGKWIKSYILSLPRT